MCQTAYYGRLLFAEHGHNAVLTGTVIDDCGNFMVRLQPNTLRDTTTRNPPDHGYMCGN